MFDEQFDARGDGIGGGLGATDKSVSHHFGMQLVVVHGAPPFLDDRID